MTKYRIKLSNGDLIQFIGDPTETLQTIHENGTLWYKLGYSRANQVRCDLVEWITQENIKESYEG